MPSLGCHHLVRLAALVLGPPLTLLFVSAPQARATCSDYVEFTRRTGGKEVADRLHSPAATHPSHQLPTQPRRPCSGPGCSHSPAVPPPSLPSPTAERGNDWDS